MPGKRRLAILLLTGAVLIAMTVLGMRYWHTATGGQCTNLVNNRTAHDQLQKLWQQDQIIVLLRHTEKCREDTISCEDLASATPMDKLTQKGIADAKVIGEGFRALLPGDFELLSSNKNRTLQTAQRAFGYLPETRYWLRENCKQELGIQLLQSRRGNQVLVTHSTCLNVLTDDAGNKLIPFNTGGHEDYGLAVFLVRRSPGDMPRVLGCAWPDDWQNLMQ